MFSHGKGNNRGPVAATEHVDTSTKYLLFVETVTLTIRDKVLCKEPWFFL